jgi:hypothetical protein
MAPVSFQVHCASCHWNSLIYDVHRLRENGVPHGLEVELARGLIRERYTRFIHERPDELKSHLARHRRPIPGPTDRDRPIETEWSWVTLQVENAGRILFQSSSGCRYCHVLESSGASLRIASTNMTTRWLKHSRFSHFSHRFSPKLPSEEGLSTRRENCTECHAFAKRSTQTADVLLPSISKCRECHNPEADPTVRARSDCVACHIYHNEVGGRRPLDLTRLRIEWKAVVKPDRVSTQLTVACTRANHSQVSPTASPRDFAPIIAWLSSESPRSSLQKLP